VVWEVPGPPGAPALVLLHGVTLTSALNWSAVVGTLARSYRLILLDQRGHGDGLRCRTFRVEDCADDVAAVAAALGIPQVVAVGYSMGGLVAQTLWRRHPRLTAGLVLCSTARNVAGSPWERSVALALPGLVTAATFMPAVHALRADLVGMHLLDRDTDPADRRWALGQMRRTSLLTALSAVQAVCGFTSHSWIGAVDVPTCVIVTRDDRVVPAHRQHRLARAIPGSTLVEIDGGHDVFLDAPGRFAAAVLAACDAVCTGATGGAAPAASGVS
ncbi:MAG TPA: alpha/beta hydrolase, partial [Pseudonocardia sp.]|nr:alpha/beta hydrolase [Pseudonocardia sp.]